MAVAESAPGGATAKESKKPRERRHAFGVRLAGSVHGRVRTDDRNSAAPYTTVIVLPRLAEDPQTWAWTTQKPTGRWQYSGFNDAAWARSAGGFGNAAIMGHPNAKVTTLWTTPDLWLRRTFTADIPANKVIQAVFNIFHDEDAEIYLNGKKLLALAGYNNGWDPFRVAGTKFRSALRAGVNTLAVHVRQTDGAQYFDLELVLDLEK